MSVAKNTLVSGSREKSLEIMVLRPPPQAARTSVCDRLSRGESSKRRTSARSSPKPTLRSSPFPRLRCPVNVQPIAPFYTVGHLLHRSSATLRSSDCRQPVVNGIRLCCAFQSELRLFPREALSSPAAFLQSAAISGKRAGGIRYRDRDTIEPLLELAEGRRPTLRPDASELGAEIPDLRDRLPGERLQGSLEGYFLGRILRESQQHLAVGGGVGLRLPANPVTHPDQMSPVNLGYIDDFAILETGKVYRLCRLRRQVFHRSSRQLDKIVATSRAEHAKPPELGAYPERLAARRPLEETPIGQRGSQARRAALVDAEHRRHLAHPVLLVNLLVEEKKP